jgi:hypothetical protein
MPVAKKKKTAAAKQVNFKFNLVPMPREIKTGKKNLKLNAAWGIIIEARDIADEYSAIQLAAESEKAFKTPWNLLKASQAKKAKLKVIIRECPVDENAPALFNEQGYKLTLSPTEIVIEAPTAQGRFYGVQTLRQIIRTSHGKAVPEAAIYDYPEMRWRGISDDISRGQVSQLFDFKETIEELAYYKINMFEPYMEDTFQFKLDPDIGRKRAAVTKTEMLEIAAHAKLHFMNYTPVFECLGHQERMLNLPQWRKYAEREDTTIMPWSFSLVKEDAFKFVCKLIDEMAEATPDTPFFHAGSDESFDIGEGQSVHRIKEIGAGKLFAEYISKLNAYITKKHGRTMMYYGDMIINHPEALEALPREAIVVDWHYHVAEDYPTTRKIMEAGFPNVIVSPGIQNWARFYPDFHNGLTNVRNFVKVGKREKAIGCVTSAWGDHGAESLRENNMLGYAYSAAICWEKNEEKAEAFIPRYVANYYGVDPESADGKYLTEIETRLGFLPVPINAIPYQLFHEVPKIEKKDAETLKQLKKLGDHIDKALEAFNKLEGELPFHEDHLPALYHAAKRFLYVAAKGITLNRIAEHYEKQKGKGINFPIIHAQLSGLLDMLLDIYGEYPTLWLRRNKFDRLDFNMDRMEYQISDLQKMIELAETDELKTQKPVSAIPLWYPENQQQPFWEFRGRRYFIREIEIKKEIATAEVQFWGFDDCNLWVNGNFVAGVEWTQRTHRQNIIGFLKPGKNILALTGVTAFPSAGQVILELVLKYTDGTEERIITDKNWKVSKVKTENWQSKMPAAGDSNWVKVKEMEGFDWFRKYLLAWYDL